MSLGRVVTDATVPLYNFANTANFFEDWLSMFDEERGILHVFILCAMFYYLGKQDVNRLFINIFTSSVLCYYKHKKNFDNHSSVKRIIHRF